MSKPVRPLVKVEDVLVFKHVKGVCPACGHDSTENNDPCIHERNPEQFIVALDGTIHHRDTVIEEKLFGKTKVWVAK